MPLLAERLAPVAEGLARRVAAHDPGGVEAATPLTNRRRKLARAEAGIRPVAAMTRTPSRRRAARWSCPDCGGPGANARHIRGIACIDADPRQTVDEFAFRFNRRMSTHRGLLFYRLLEQAAEVGPYPTRKLVGGIANPYM